MNQIFLLLGSNLGDKGKILSQTLNLIRYRIGHVFITSSQYETEPWGNKNQPNFINQVAGVETILGPNDLLDICKKIEKESGREESEKWGPRLIDLDILFFGNEIYQSEKLTIPHPQLHLRRFTLEPLNEIMPDLVHPVFAKSISQLLEECPDHCLVKKVETHEL